MALPETEIEDVEDDIELDEDVDLGLEDDQIDEETESEDESELEDEQSDETDSDESGSEDDEKPKKEVVKENSTISQMREQLNVLKRQNQQYEAERTRQQQLLIQQQLASAPMEEPTFESCGFDPDKYKTELLAYNNAKAERDKIITQQAQRKQQADQLWQNAQQRYAEGRKGFNATEYRNAELTVETELSPEQINWLLVSTERPNKIVSILGKDEKLLASLKKAQTPFAFAAMIGKIEVARSVEVKKKAVAPEKRPAASSSGTSGATTGRNSAYEKAVEKAKATGDMSILRNFPREKKNH